MAEPSPGDRPGADSRHGSYRADAPVRQRIRRVQGAGESRARQATGADRDDALALEEAGAVRHRTGSGSGSMLAKLIISEQLSIPTIGIGAGKYCDGQILVVHDMLGLYSDFTPKFVKQYARLRGTMAEAVGTYVSEVRSQQFPEKQHTFTISDDVLEKLY